MSKEDTQFVDIVFSSKLHRAIFKIYAMNFNIMRRLIAMQCYNEEECNHIQFQESHIHPVLNITFSMVQIFTTTVTKKRF